MDRDHRGDAGSSLPDRLFEAFEEASTENESVIREELAECGADPDRVVADGLHLVRELLGQQKLSRAQTEYRRVRNAIHDLTQCAGERSKDIKDRIARSLAGEGNEQMVLVFHRKLESVEPEDLASLDDEKKLLNLIKRLKEEE